MEWKGLLFAFASGQRQHPCQVAYECLCGHRPFGDSQFVVEYESRHEPAPVDMKPMVDVGISEVCAATFLACFCLSFNFCGFINEAATFIPVEFGV